jgi:hypothetical protein
MSEKNTMTRQDGRRKRNREGGPAVPLTIDQAIIIPGQLDRDTQAAAALADFDLESILSLAGNVKTCPHDVQAMLALSSLGWKDTRIAKVLGVSKQTVYSQVRRYDPERIFRSNPAAVLALRASMQMVRAEQVLWSITDEDLKNADLRSKAYCYERLSKGAMDLIDRANAITAPDKTRDIEAIMTNLKGKSAQAIE